MSKSEVQRILGLFTGASPISNVICAGDVTNTTSAVDAEVEPTKQQILIIRAQHDTMHGSRSYVPDAKLLEKVTMSGEVIPPPKVVSRITHTISSCPSVTSIVSLGKRISASVENPLTEIDPMTALLQYHACV